MQLLDLALLQTATGYPCVSVLARRRAARTGTRVAVQALLTDAERRLSDELGTAASSPLVDRLRALAALPAPDTAVSVAILVGPSVGRLVPLPVEVRDRVVIDHSFATRDLVRAYHRTIPYWLVAIDHRSCTVYDGNGPTLEPIRRMDVAGADDRLVMHLDALLDELAEGAVPVLLAGCGTVVDEVARRSRRNFAAAIRTETTSADALASSARPVLDELAATREAAALDELTVGPTVSGIHAVWDALHDRRVELLAVEEDHAVAARVDGRNLHIVDNGEEPGVVDDIIDDAVEAAMAGRGRIVFLPSGALRRRGHDAIAARLRA